MKNNLNRLAIGTAQFGLDYGIANHQGQVSYNAIEEILEHAHSNGINTIDTAIAYGESEKILGMIGVQDWKVISKASVPSDISNASEWITESVEKSLERLNLDCIDGMLLHNPQQISDLNGDEIFQSLYRLKEKSIIKNIGISIYDADILNVLCDRYQLDIVQAPINILDRRMLNSGWISRLSKLGIELHARSIFLQGLLLMDLNERPEQFNRWADIWNKWNSWLNKNNKSALQACLNYVSSISDIKNIIIGIDNFQHLRQIINIFKESTYNFSLDIESHDLDLIDPSRWNLNT